MKKLYFAFFLFGSLFSQAQYTQNFDTSLVSTGAGLYTQLPDGWGIYEVGTGTNADGKYAVGTGSSNTGNAYSFGVAGAGPLSDRSLGTIASGTNFPSLGAIFFNERDSVMTTVTVSFTGEQWRYGGRTTGTKDTLRFEYSLDASGIVNNVGTFIRVKPLDFLSVNITGTAAATLDGNAPANRQAITYTITGLNIQPGQSIVLRWSDFDIASNDDGLSIDDFSISAGLAPGVMTSGGTNTGGGTGGGGGTVSNTSTSTPIFQNKVAIDSGFVHLYGNLHGHSTHSDGKPSTLQPADDYNFARQAQGMDFLGISEHNHSTAGLQIANYHLGDMQANAADGQLNAAGNRFTAMHGMEWGTISGGGHALVYGFKDSLLGWEAGNYDVFVPKSDYLALFEKVRSQPGAIALLAHPNTSDFSGLTGGYKGVADSAVCSVAIESGPAFSTSTTYSDFPSSLAYINYYRSLLKQGYRLGAHMDQDNHEMTFGTANPNRMVVLAAARSREAILSAIGAMRVYATNDYTAKVDFTLNGYIMGSSILSKDMLTFQINHTDGEGEAVSAIQLYGGKVRGGDATLIQSSTTNLSTTIDQPVGENWYYYAIITQMDGNKIITSPIWYTKLSFTLPVTLQDFTARLQGSAVAVNWLTATELSSDYFEVERSGDNRIFVAIGKMSARGIASAYSLTDASPLVGTGYYRLKEVSKSGEITYTQVVLVRNDKAVTVSLFPNPSKDGAVTVKRTASTSETVLVQVIDVAGNMVYSRQHSGAQFTLDLSRLPGGFYLVRVGDVLTQLLITK